MCIVKLHCSVSCATFRATRSLNLYCFQNNKIELIMSNRRKNVCCKARSIDIRHVHECIVYYYVVQYIQETTGLQI